MPWHCLNDKGLPHSIDADLPTYSHHGENMNTTPREEIAQAGDMLSCLVRIEPGYIELAAPDGTLDYLIIFDFPMAPGFPVSVGFRHDTVVAGGDLGDPVFLHRNMSFRHLGAAEAYLQDSLVQRVLASLEFDYPERCGMIPLIRVVELVRSGKALAAEASSILSAFLAATGRLGD
jgi:hypothetical protein